MYYVPNKIQCTHLMTTENAMAATLTFLYMLLDKTSPSFNKQA